jgi:Amt family ammonium transporter
MEGGLLITLFAASALLIRVGQGLYSSGLSRSKNVASAWMRIMVDLCVSSLAFWAVGAAVLAGFEVSMLFGGAGGTEDRAAVQFVPLTIFLLGTAIVPCATAERMRLFPLIVVSAILGGVIMPLVGQWAWFGWLARMEFVDAGGATVVHLSGAICAAVAAVFVGPRTGKYNRDGSSNMIPGHSIALTAAGVLVMFVGWMPYAYATGGLHGSAPPAATALNVLFAAAAGGVVSLIFCQIRYGKPDVLLFFSGLLGALVASTAGASLVSSRIAVIIGAIAGLLVPLMIVVIDLRLKIDDPAAVIAIHGVGGLWGTIATGFFVRETMVGRLKQLAVQLTGAAAIGALVLAVSLAIFFVLRRKLRAREADEYDGLDLAELDMNAYPDFHQTMIKSYHLREA